MRTDKKRKKDMDYCRLLSEENRRLREEGAARRSARIGRCRPDESARVVTVSDGVRTEVRGRCPGGCLWRRRNGGMEICDL